MKIESSALTPWHGTNSHNCHGHNCHVQFWRSKVDDLGKSKTLRSEKVGNHPKIGSCHHHMWLRKSGHPHFFMAIEGIDDDRNQPGSTILSKKNPYIDDEKKG